MNLAKNYQQMAKYNQWMTEKIYSQTSHLSDAQFREDLGAFWKSIHSTMNHILWADIVWMKRFNVSLPYQPSDMGVDLFADRKMLETTHKEVILCLQEWTHTFNDDWLAGDLVWTRASNGETYTKPRWLCITHIFNHQTHHRGQVTHMLRHFDIDIGDTDLPLMPTD